MAVYQLIPSVAVHTTTTGNSASQTACDSVGIDQLFSNTFFSQLFDKYGCSSIDLHYMSARLTSIYCAIDSVFTKNPHLPRRVLDIGCGNTSHDFDQLLSDEYAPWVCRSYGFISTLSQSQSAYSRYCLESIVGVDLGFIRDTAYTHYEVDVFSPAFASTVTQPLASFGVCIASLFFTSPRLSVQRFGDFRLDSPKQSDLSDLMHKLDKSITPFMSQGDQGIILYAL
jgi:hypothetical protein